MKNNQSHWEDLDESILSGISSGQSLICFEHQDHPLAAVLIDRKIFIIRNRCPHMGASFHGGWIEHGKLVCPKHRYRFHPEAQDPNLSPGCLRIVPSRIQDYKLQIQLNP